MCKIILVLTCIRIPSKRNSASIFVLEIYSFFYIKLRVGRRYSGGNLTWETHFLATVFSFCYDPTKPNSHGGWLPGNPGADSIMGHVQPHQRPGNDLPCLSWVREAVMVGLERGRPTHQSFSPCCLPPKGTNKTNGAASPCLPQMETGVFLSLCLLNPANGELESYTPF